ncbi:phosphate ABC transporter permease PstA [Paraconexibacter antarcticus]|uniref:Phosphate transport system permease protein PstA n=1 Tax=Paraconexibacter antarcticus TaxID=2949664 RepID=A0ABY5DM53_9ACTN|nr:phosphate ABC transporter permease PstA [Paraconexibacter antarcticus]UTI63005.1 phosphate ABC transporter permease PstA [Paraconexibacter antarcticus]
MSTPSSAATLLAPVSGRRRTTDLIMRGLLGLGTVIALIPLVLVIYYLFSRGLKGIGSGFFTTDPTGNFLGDPGGVKSAIIGTLEIVGLASVIAIPLGIGVALYLVEFGKKTVFAQIVRYLVDVMTGVPSIVFGLFVYITLVTTKFGGASFTGYKGSFALALLMLPVVTRSAEVVLGLVPEALREAALALGVPRWKVTLKIVLPTALPGLITGSLLAVARGMGETAPLLFTAATVNGTTYNLGQRMNSLPAQIYADISQPNNDIVNRAWAAALTLVVLILVITLIARVAARRSRVS